MAAPSGKFYPVGMKHARVYVLNANGVPDASGTTPYEGYQLTGAKAYELNIPDARRISHTGDDRVLAQDVLPRQEPSSGTLRVARMDHDVLAALTSTNAFTIGESAGAGYGTDKQGSEPSVALLCYQQAKNATSGARTYRSYHVPSTQAIVKPASMNENAPEISVDLLPSAADHHIWGIKMATGTEGYTQAEMEEFETVDLPHIVAWKADGTITTFPFNTSRPAVSTAKVHAVATIAPSGTITDVTGTCTKGTANIQITGPLAANTVVVCWYEYAD